LLACILTLIVGSFALAPATPIHAGDGIPDLFNLGPIGGKAEVVRSGLPDGARSGLKVAEVYKVGPAQVAGLKVGDVIVGVGDKLFGEDAYLELADGILAAEAAAEPVCTLKVMRSAETITISVRLTHFADEAARRKAIHEAALKWLSKQQDSKTGGFYSTMSPEVSQVVLTSLAGLCWLSAGDFGNGGAYDAEILKAADFVSDTVGEQKQYKKLAGKNNNQTNWGLGYGGIFLAHVV
jgi:hypothetical protein